MNQEVAEVLSAMAAQMNTTVEFLWGVLRKQALVEAFSTVLFLLMLGGAWWLVVRKWLPFAAKKAENDRYGENEGYMIALTIASGVLCLVSLVTVIAAFDTIPTAILNPDYYALKKILEALK